MPNIPGARGEAVQRPARTTRSADTSHESKKQSILNMYINNKQLIKFYLPSCIPIREWRVMMNTETLNRELFVRFMQRWFKDKFKSFGHLHLCLTHTQIEFHSWDPPPPPEVTAGIGIMVIFLYNCCYLCWGSMAFWYGSGCGNGSVPQTNGSGCRSVRHKNIRILRIRIQVLIRNTRTFKSFFKDKKS